MDLDPKKIKDEAIAVLVDTVFRLHDSRSATEVFECQMALEDWDWNYDYFMKESDPEFLREVQAWTKGWRR